jgi:TPR repeat protein
MRIFAFVAAAALLGSGAAAAQPSQEGPLRQRTGSIRPPEETVEQLRARAQAGDRDAQTDLALRLVDGGDAAQLAEARRWAERAAEGGDAEAMNNFATMLLLGIGGPADETRGRRLREEAAGMGSVGANLSLAERYVHGAEGYPRDPARAIEHLRAAGAANGRAALFAQWRLAMMHLEGVGTPRDPQEAYRLLVAASEAGGVNAMISRAVMLATGEGIAEDDVAARQWYQRAAESGERGFEHALRALGGMLAVGEGGPADLPRGIAFLRVAAAAGDEHAGRILDGFAPRVTPAVEAEAQRIAREWMERHLPRE